MTPEVPVAQVAPVVQIQLPDPQLQPVYVKEAPPESLNSTFEYFIKAEEIPEVNAVVCVIDVAIQVSRPSSAASSPRPLVGVRIEAIITGTKPVFQALTSHVTRLLPPPPVYPDSAPRVRRRLPQTLVVRRHTRSSDEPLLEPLLTDRCFLLLIVDFA